MKSTNDAIRDQKVPAPLKLGGSRNVCRERGAPIRDQKVPAPLKHRILTADQHAVATIRDQKVPAPLKLGRSRQEVRPDRRYPGPKGPGPIEATDLRARTIEREEVYPGPKGPGPIEALPSKMLAEKTATAIRDQKVPAPLKLEITAPTRPQILLSGTKRSRPH